MKKAKQLLNRRDFVRRASSNILVPAAFVGLGGGIRSILRAQTAPSLQVSGTARVGSVVRPAAGGGTALNTDLIAYWKMDETGTNNREDSQGANDLVANGAVTQRSGKIGNAVDLSGSGTWLSCADNDDLSFADEFMSWVGWVQFDTFNSFNLIIDKWVAGSLEYNFHYNNSVSRFRMQACTNGSSGAVTLTLDSFGAASTSTWYFFAFGHDPTNNVLWGSINNGTVDTTSFSGGLFSGTQGLRIGIDSGSGNPVDGAIDEVGLWGKRPSADELSELYNSGNAKTCCPFS